VITPKSYETGCQLLLITNRKSHKGFRLVPTSMTLNAVLALFTKFGIFSGRLYHNWASCNTSSDATEEVSETCKQWNPARTVFW